MSKIDSVKLREWLSKSSLEHYIQREDLHRFIKVKNNGDEFSPVINFYVAIMSQAIVDKDIKYLNSELFELHCEILLLNSDIIKYQIKRMWK